MIEYFKLPSGDEVSFNPEGHIYTVNGIELPSITGLLKKVYGDMYANVNPELLKRSAEYGTAVHEELQISIEKRKVDKNCTIIPIHQEVENYFNFIEPIYKVEPLTTEKIVVLKDEKGTPVAAGRFDLICNIDGKLSIVDFKTTSTVHKQSVTAQLNLYAKACKDSGYLEQDQEVKLGVIHLSGFTAKYIPIPLLDKNFYLQFIK